MLGYGMRFQHTIALAKIENDFTLKTPIDKEKRNEAF